MSTLKNLKDHNLAKLELIKNKSKAAEKAAKEEINELIGKVDIFINTYEKQVVSELALLNVEEELPDTTLNIENFSKVINRKDFTLSDKKAKGSMFKNFICSLFTGTLISGGVILYKFFDLKLISMDTIQKAPEALTKDNLVVALNSLDKMIPANITTAVPDISSSIILGVLSGLIFIVLFSISEFFRKRRVKKVEEEAYVELEEYDVYIKNKLHTYADISVYVKRVIKLIDGLTILLDEEKAKLRRINYMKDPEDKLDLKTVKDITRTVNLLKHANEFLTSEICDDDELSYESTDALRETEEYINKHIKKIYREDD